MLDHIYQSAIDSDNIDAFIIFTGDGHFSSVVSYLVTKCRKEVGIFAVRDALSSQLKNSASYSITVPSNEELTLHIKRLIIKAINTVYEENAKPRPTFLATAQAVAKNSPAELDTVKSVMNSLIKDGVIFQKRIKVGYNKSIKILAINRHLAKAQNII